MKLRIKTGDQVKVIAGKNKGKTGKVLQTFPALNRVVVEGVNAATRHLRTRTSGQKGQKVEFFMPMHASNVLPVEENGTTRRHRRTASATAPATPAKSAAKKAA